MIQTVRVAAKSKVSRHLGIDNDNPLGKPAKDEGNAVQSETLSGVATGHETVTTSEITPPETNTSKKNNAKSGFVISSRLQEKVDEQNDNP